MGAVKNILAKDFLGNWMTMYSATVNGDIQALYNKFTQYRYFRPNLCGTPFPTKHIRYLLYCAVYCAVLHCAVYCAVYCAALYCTVLYCTVMQYNVLHSKHLRILFCPEPSYPNLSYPILTYPDTIRHTLVFSTVSSTMFPCAYCISMSSLHLRLYIMKMISD